MERTRTKICFGSDVEILTLQSVKHKEIKFKICEIAIFRIITCGGFYQRQHFCSLKNSQFRCFASLSFSLFNDCNFIPSASGGRSIDIHNFQTLMKLPSHTM